MNAKREAVLQAAHGLVIGVSYIDYLPKKPAGFYKAEDMPRLKYVGRETSRAAQIEYGTPQYSVLRLRKGSAQTAKQPEARYTAVIRFAYAYETKDC